MRKSAGNRRGVSRRGFLGAVAVGALGAQGALRADAQTATTTKDTLRPVADGSDLAITDQQLAKLAPAVEWSRGEMRKLRDVDVGLGGPAPVFLPAAGAGRP